MRVFNYYHVKSMGYQPLIVLLNQSIQLYFTSHESLNNYITNIIKKNMSY